MSTVIFTISHRSMISSAHHRNKKGLPTYNFQIIWLCISHNNNQDRRLAKQHAPWGTWYEFGQPSVHSDSCISKVADYLKFTCRKIFLAHSGDRGKEKFPCFLNQRLNPPPPPNKRNPVSLFSSEATHKLISLRACHESYCYWTNVKYRNHDHIVFSRI